MKATTVSILINIMKLFFYSGRVKRNEAGGESSGLAAGGGPAVMYLPLGGGGSAGRLADLAGFFPDPTFEKNNRIQQSEKVEENQI